MMRVFPGDIIQYRTSGSFFPLWPAVICEEDMASRELIDVRPRGNTTLVLLMGEDLQLYETLEIEEHLDFANSRSRWAHTTDIGNYDPFTPVTHEEVVRSTPGLGDAYDMADNALGAHLGIAHWRGQLTNLVSDASAMVSHMNDSDDDSHSDLEMQQALRLSREDYDKRSRGRNAKGSSHSPTSSMSHTRPARYPESRRVPVIAGAGSAPNTGLNALEVVSGPVASSSRHSKSHEELCAAPPTIDLTDDGGVSSSTEERTIEPRPFQHGFFDNQLGGMGRRRKEPVSDVIEGELSESKEFVQVPVGPDQEIHNLRLQNLWDRPYFRDAKQGLLLIDHNDQGMWELKHPALVDIEPDDFTFIAEFLESDGFGHRYPQEGEEMEEAFAQCVSTWITAEKIGMTDLLDHVVEKLEALEGLELLPVLAFASHVYTQDTPFFSQKNLKDYLAVYMAENFLIYIRDDHLRTVFLERLQRFPEMERDIYRRRILVLDERVDQMQESDAEMD